VPTDQDANFLDLFHGDNREQVPDFAALKASGIVAIAHKATQGTDYVDPRYHVRMIAAKAAGLAWIAYHFGNAADAAKQAAHFTAVAGLQDGDGACLDFEDCPKSQMALHQAQDFLQLVDVSVPRAGLTWLYSGNRIRETLVTAPGGHVNAGMVQAAAFFDRHPLWLARYNSNEGAPPPPWLATVAWQFTESGTAKAIAGHVDENLLQVTPGKLAEMLKAT
jgi:lysozyme